MDVEDTAGLYDVEDDPLCLHLRQVEANAGPDGTGLACGSVDTKCAETRVAKRGGKACRASKKLKGDHISDGEASQRMVQYRWRGLEGCGHRGWGFAQLRCT